MKGSSVSTACLILLTVAVLVTLGVQVYTNLAQLHLNQHYSQVLVDDPNNGNLNGPNNPNFNNPNGANR